MKRKWNTSPSLTTEVFHARFRRHLTSIKNALLDQIAGLGNIYVSEALWQARLSPLRVTNTITLPETEVLLQQIRDVLGRAIAAGGSTLRDHFHPEGHSGSFQHSFKVYNRENMPCGHCQVSYNPQNCSRRQINILLCLLSTLVF